MSSALSTRAPPLPRSELTGAVKEVNDSIEAVCRKSFGSLFVWSEPSDSSNANAPPDEDGNVQLLGPVQLLATNPSMVKPTHDLLLVGMAGLRSLPPNAREIGTLAAAAASECAYVRYCHERLAITAPCSLTTEQVRCVSRLVKPEGLDDVSDLAADVAFELVGKDRHKGPLSQKLWDRGALLMGKEGMMALAHVIGIYQYMCTLMNAADCPLPEGEAFL